MASASEYTYYGIPGPNDARYRSRPEVDLYCAARCPACRLHLVARPVRRCDLEIARAAEMDDPRWCLRCGLAFDRRSAPVTSQARQGRDLCGPCQGAQA